MIARSLPPLFSLIALFSPLAAQEKKIESLKFEHEVLREDVRNRAETERADLYRKYAGAIDRLAGEFQRKGDLDSVLLLQKEAELARGSASHGSDESPILVEVRETLESALQKIADQEQEEYGKLDRKLIATLKPLQVEWTKAGEIDEALLVKEWIEQLTANTPPPASTPSTPASSQPGGGDERLQLVAKPIKDSPLYLKTAFTGKLELEPGQYSGFERFEMGDHEIKDREDKEGFLTIPPGCELSDGVIYGNIAEITVSGSYFHEMEFWQNLHSDFSAERSLFDQCIFKKAGAWFGGVSSRWIFNDCVISSSFFPSWKKKQVGVQARETTFEGITFAPYPYHTDAGVEAVDDWWVFERCLFRNCTIPESLLIATEECLFENCTFVPEKVLITSKVRTKLYHRGPAPKMPDEQDLISYELLPESRLTRKQTGSTLGYSLLGRNAVPTR